MTPFTIQITSDTVCPWCYVGLRRLQRAITAFQSSKGGQAANPFTIQWVPFYLNPSAPATSIPKDLAYEEKFGAERAEHIFQNLAAVGEMENIRFSFGGKTGKTKDSHRVIEWAATQDVEPKGKDGSGSDTLQTRVVEQLFADYFEKERDITLHQVLSDAYLRALAMHSPNANQSEAKTKVEQFLASNELSHEVDNGVNTAKRQGVNGVPNFVINDRFEVSGAQEPTAFVALFERILKLDSKESI